MVDQVGKGVDCASTMLMLHIQESLSAESSFFHLVSVSLCGLLSSFDERLCNSEDGGVHGQVGLKLGKCKTYIFRFRTILH